MQEAVQRAHSTLDAAGIPDAWLEAELLVCQARGALRTEMHACPEAALTPEQAAGLEALLRRRCRREPFSYLLGRREFYGLGFEVTPAVLVPRPETELLVEEALGWWAREKRRSDLYQAPRLIADVGTGSGCLAITLARMLPDALVYAIDCSNEALAVARRNCLRHEVWQQVQLLLGDLLTPAPVPVDLIVANLPYVPTSEMAGLQPEVRDYEPRLALDGGPDGAEHIMRLLKTARAKLRLGGALLLEFHPPQRALLEAVAAACFPGARVRVVPDLAGLDRMLSVETPLE